jgi:hypothetical protein
VQIKVPFKEKGGQEAPESIYPTEVNRKQIGIKAMDLDYLHLPQTVAAEKKRVQKAAPTAKELSNKPSVH